MSMTERGLLGTGFLPVVAGGDGGQRHGRATAAQTRARLPGGPGAGPPVAGRFGSVLSEAHHGNQDSGSGIEGQKLSRSQGTGRRARRRGGSQPGSGCGPHDPGYPSLAVSGWGRHVAASGAPGVPGVAGRPGSVR